MWKKRYSKYKENIIVILLLMLGVFVRIYQFGQVPGGINQDEAYAGYEAWALINYGHDSQGYHNPLYMVAWGSGMNALNSYLMMPWIRIWGLNCITVRLPQLILSIASLPVFYLLLKKIRDQKVALIGLFVFAINPWHIMASRWGLESNLLPAFLLYGCYFIILGVEKKRYFYLSAVCYGLSLYAYATIWPIMPFIIGTELLYIQKCKKLPGHRHVIGYGSILFLMAAPLILFLMIQFGWIEEIRTPYFSIPRLYEFRGAEFGLSDIDTKLKKLLKLLLGQNDGFIHNSPSNALYGQYYFYGLPFIAIGFLSVVKSCIRDLKKGIWNAEGLLLIWTVFSLLQALMIHAVNVNKINYLYIPLLLFLSIGISRTIDVLHIKWVKACMLGFMFCCFLCFSEYYFTKYKEETAISFDEGLGEAFAFAKQVSEEEQDIWCDVIYSKVLFYTQTDPNVFYDTVKYEEFPHKYLSPESFGNISFGWHPEKLYDNDTIVIIKTEILDEQGGCPSNRRMKAFGIYSVVY